MEKGRHTVAPSLDSERKAGSECKLESRTSAFGEEFRYRPWRFVQPIAYQGRRSLRLLTQQLNLRGPTEGAARCKWNQLPNSFQRVPDSRPQRLRTRRWLNVRVSCLRSAHGVRTCARPAEPIIVRHLIGIVLRTHNANGPVTVPSTVQRPP
jgi:hypothetical protein